MPVYPPSWGKTYSPAEVSACPNNIPPPVGKFFRLFPFVGEAAKATNALRRPGRSERGVCEVGEQGGKADRGEFQFFEAPQEPPGPWHCLISAPQTAEVLVWCALHMPFSQGSLCFHFVFPPSNSFLLLSLPLALGKCIKRNFRGGVCVCVRTHTRAQASKSLHPLGCYICFGWKKDLGVNKNAGNAQIMRE